MDVDTDAFNFADLEVSEPEPEFIPPPDFEAPKESNMLTCKEPGCNAPLVYSGKGRKPTKCEVHKRRSSGSGSRSKKHVGPDYREGILGLLQLPAAALAFAGMNGKPELLADSTTIAMHAPNIANAVNDLALARPEIAAVLDRVMQVGPYSVLIAAMLPMVLQILTNHGIVPPGLMGTVSKEDLLGMPPQASQRESDPQYA
jgi:hypothetical protein